MMAANQDANVIAVGVAQVEDCSFAETEIAASLYTLRRPKVHLLQTRREKACAYKNISFYSVYSVFFPPVREYILELEGFIRRTNPCLDKRVAC
jgi:hypothetical protein